MTLTTEETVILNKRIEIDVLEAKLAKKREGYNADTTLDEEVLYAKRLALSKILEAQE
jgi:hypothetical protein